MDILIYDGSLEGLLCCVFEQYERKLKDVKIVEEIFWTSSPFDNEIQVVSASEKAGRVWKGLQSNLSPVGLFDFYRCYLSELPDSGQLLFDYALYIFDNAGTKPEKNFGNEKVLKVAQISRKVGREKHRFEAFVRFKTTADGIYFAAIEPDFNIIPLITDHYRKRFSDQKWLIYDMKRNYGIFYDLAVVNPITLDREELSSKLKESKVTFSEEEEVFERLWRTYFKSTNIEARKNTKLHLQHLPKRYWKYLTEKQLY